MLLRNPKDFERVAREWAVMYAGATRKEIAESSGGATAASLRQRALKSREEQEQEELAA
jgi:ubiquitin-conjugating enzyme (huntingtin interacting protein 2)